MRDSSSRRLGVPAYAFWAVCVLNATLICFGLVIFAQKEEGSDPLRVRHLEVIDDRGRVRFKISGGLSDGGHDPSRLVAYDQDGSEVLTFSSSSTLAASLVVGRKNGGAGVETVVSKSGSASVFVFDDDGSPIITVGRSDIGAGSIVTFKNSTEQVAIGSTAASSGSISVFGSEGNPVAAVFGSPGDVGTICVFDGQASEGGKAAIGSVRVYMSANQHGGLMSVFNAAGAPVVECEALPSGGGALQCMSSGGRGAVLIGSSANKLPTIDLLAADGSRLVGIGSPDGAFGSLALFGPGMRPVFAAGGDADGGRSMVFDAEGVPRNP
jgi:hypothetical protein